MGEPTPHVFEQVGPRLAEAPDGATVELLDTHHARLSTSSSTWLVEVALREDEWLAVTVFADSLVRSGGTPDQRARERALDRVVAGLRALRVRVVVETALSPEDPQVTPAPADDAVAGPDTAP